MNLTLSQSFHFYWQSSEMNRQVYTWTFSRITSHVCSVHWKLWIRQCAFVWLMHRIHRSWTVSVDADLMRWNLSGRGSKSESESGKRSLPNLSNSYEQIDLWALTIPGKSAHFCWVNDIFKCSPRSGKYEWKGLYCTSASVYSVKCNYCCVSRRYCD